ncbi:prolyl aminopeptidase [Actinophytocola xanthii]|uniref:Proline iminopeptidase n=1 Tax=Actinophytocola xanthii TaxID=1912961 RepID=A0A1Q8CWA3_9PSEU|nr:prolyl aminopeptidase [Actinophytocola xanthii]OLF18640.1 prolyl aminopeptidase [Actinophytocola xanthii]
MYPPLNPYDQGRLHVGGGEYVYWEQCGNPAGKPALVLHGGPGSGCGPGHRRWFDPRRYRVVLMDQRNCGRSTPHAGDPDTDLSANTTPNLLADLELLRTTLGIERWLVFGGSWGSVLGLAYAQAFPERVSELVLFAVATGRQEEVDLLVRGLRPLFPEAWAAFREAAGDPSEGVDLPTAYARRLNSGSAEDRAAAASAWCAWEDAIVPTTGPSERYRDPRFRLGFARIVTHYWSRGHFLGEDGVLLAGAGRLAGIPGVIVQGRLDFGNLAGSPWLLDHAWPDGRLVMVDEGAHETATPGMTGALLAALDGFAEIG